MASRSSTGGPFTVGNCHFYLPAGTVTSGKHYDCGIVRAPTSITEATSAICWGTYTTTSTTSPAAWVSVTPSGCPTLPSEHQAYWVFMDTDDPISFPPDGFYDQAAPLRRRRANVGKRDISLSLSGR